MTSGFKALTEASRHKSAAPLMIGFAVAALLALLAQRLSIAGYLELLHDNSFADGKFMLLPGSMGAVAVAVLPAVVLLLISAIALIAVHTVKLRNLKQQSAAEQPYSYSVNPH